MIPLLQTIQVDPSILSAIKDIGIPGVFAIGLLLLAWRLIPLLSRSLEKLTDALKTSQEQQEKVADKFDRALSAISADRQADHQQLIDDRKQEDERIKLRQGAIDATNAQIQQQAKNIEALIESLNHLGGVVKEQGDGLPKLLTDAFQAQSERIVTFNSQSAEAIGLRHAATAELLTASLGKVDTMVTEFKDQASSQFLEIKSLLARIDTKLDEIAQHNSDQIDAAAKDIRQQLSEVEKKIEQLSLTTTPSQLDTDTPSKE
jgi:hypothetical protein